MILVRAMRARWVASTRALTRASGVHRDEITIVRREQHDQCRRESDQQLDQGDAALVADQSRAAFTGSHRFRSRCW